MKTQHNKRRKTRSSSKSLKAAHENDRFDNVDQVAEELNTLARQRFSNSIRRGILTGCEDDIRQEAVLLALGWYLGNLATPHHETVHQWHAPRAIAGALRIIKRDYLKLRLGEAEAFQEMRLSGNGMIQHPVMNRCCDWPTSAMRAIVSKAIRIALRAGGITHANAAVALAVLVDEVPINEIAKHRNVHRSSIHQHLTRVRRYIPGIINDLEVSLHDV